MDAQLNRKSLALGVPGIVLQVAGNIWLNTQATGDPPIPPLGVALGALAVILTGTVLLIAGLSWYAKAKGHSGWWGLLGLLSIIGLLVLALLPDRLKQPR
jgi:amino acid transporter